MAKQFSGDVIARPRQRWSMYGWLLATSTAGWSRATRTSLAHNRLPIASESQCVVLAGNQATLYERVTPGPG